MKILLAAAAAIITMAAVPAGAAILPVGVQTNVASSTITGTWGFSQCWSGNYNGMDSIASMLAGCQGDYLMMAAKVIGSDEFVVAAAANYADVIFATGGQNDPSNSHEANDVEWYFDPSWSWGFAPKDAIVATYSCDVGAFYGTDDSAQRLCWHTWNNMLDTGWSAGGLGNTYGGDYERFLFVGNAGPDPVPEPGALGLLGLGVLGLATRRRRRG
ncbi:MAG: PEP-CTERM sorting domain-containing protein [Sphingomonadaceae bacterium]|nr:PEP-CTERM sorting domain-containing protein [Sphingomonadaceae bacterium]